MLATPQPLQWSDKSPADVVDYGVDWTAVLAALGNDTISSVTWTVPAGLTGGTEAQTGALTTIVLSGGTVGTSYTVQCQITTTGGRTIRRNVLIQVREV